MCKRTTPDPLVRMFLDRYKLNLLAVPRRDARCGQVHVRHGRRVSSAIELAHLLDAPIELPPRYAGEPLAGLSGTLSDGVSLRLGLGLLEGFLGAIGAAAAVADVRARFERSRSARLRFRFADPTRDSLDPGALGTALAGRSLSASHPLVRDGNEYFVTTAVVRSPAIDVVAEDGRGHRVDLGGELVAAVNAHAGVELESSANGALTFSGPAPLAIALELYELRHDPQRARLTMLPQDQDDRVRAGREPRPEPVFAAPDDDALLALQAL